MSRRYRGDGDINSMSEFHNADGTTKPPEEICGFWTADGANGAAIQASVRNTPSLSGDQMQS